LSVDAAKTIVHVFISLLPPGYFISLNPIYMRYNWMYEFNKLSTFRRRLKTYLFSLSFRDIRATTSLTVVPEVIYIT